MALLAGSVLLDQISAQPSVNRYVSYLAVFASGAAAAICVLAFMRWKANEIAMRNEQPLPSFLFAPWLAVGFMAAAIAVVVVLVMHL